MQSEQLTQKVAHTLKLRLLTVKKRRELGPDMVRITLEGSDLEGFYTPGFDDHVKLIFPDPITKELRLPQMGDNLLAKKSTEPTKSIQSTKLTIATKAIVGTKATSKEASSDKAMINKSVVGVWPLRQLGKLSKMRLEFC